MYCGTDRISVVINGAVELDMLMNMAYVPKHFDMGGRVLANSIATPFSGDIRRVRAYTGQFSVEALIEMTK